jgi:coproporphyrinogen III oxidase-like Fe-S oxidoreductase
MSLTKLRQHVHTYPLKFEVAGGEDVFPLERAALYVHIPFCST